MKSNINIIDGSSLYYDNIINYRFRTENKSFTPWLVLWSRDIMRSEIRFTPLENFKHFVL